MKGFGLNRTLRILEIPKSTWYYRQRHKLNYGEKYAHIKKDLLQTVKQHPAYGWRKLQVELREKYGHKINHKTLKKLLNIWQLALPGKVGRTRKNRRVKLIQEVGDRANLVKGIQNPSPFEVIITDFTWIYYLQGKRRVALVAYEDYAGKMVYGYALGASPNTELALTGWREAKKTLEGLGVKVEGGIVHQDQDSVFTGYEYVRQMAVNDNAVLLYAKKGTPGENAAKESFISHFKMENKSLFLETRSFKELKGIVENRINYYNEERRHQSLGYLTPREHLKKWQFGLEKREKITV